MPFVCINSLLVFLTATNIKISSIEGESYFSFHILNEFSIQSTHELIHKKFPTLTLRRLKGQSFEF